MSMNNVKNLELSFAPVANPRPKTLTPGQIDQYNRLGYVAPFDAYSADEIAAHRAYIDGLLRDMGAEGAYGINCYQARLSGLWDIATEARILDHVEDIIGPNIICWATAVLSKPPRTEQHIPWHQDASFWSLTPARTVTVWLAIDDVDEDNAAMLWIPATHNKGCFRQERSGENAVFHVQAADAEAMGEAVANTLKAGQFSLHADMILHGSRANLSDRRRCGLTLRYCPPEVRIVDAEWSQGVEAIVCRGEDSGGLWRHHPRPDNNDITKTTTPRPYGNN